MQVEFELDDFNHGDGELISEQITIMVDAEIDHDELWGFRCQTVAYDPYVVIARFSADLHILSPIANKEYARWLNDRYRLHDGFRQTINKKALNAYWSQKESAEIEAMEARG